MSTKLKRLIDAATPGPWAVPMVRGEYRLIKGVVGDYGITTDHNAELICYLVNNAIAINELIEIANEVDEWDRPNEAHTRFDALSKTLAKLQGEKDV